MSEQIKKAFHAEYGISFDAAMQNYDNRTLANGFMCGYNAALFDQSSYIIKLEKIVAQFAMFVGDQSDEDKEIIKQVKWYGRSLTDKESNVLHNLTPTIYSRVEPSAILTHEDQ